ncbi:hypothetical protein [Kitasatospora sp. NPDC088548]|uniref:hypothetical protein n=1 Tax=Kitasatospora sp. NPDC088548 TaxID=3364075 RepID=UPI00380EA185
MSALPVEYGPIQVPRTYNSIVLALPGELTAQFTDEFHEADPFSAGRVLEQWGRVADALSDPATYAAADRSVPALTGVSLADVLDEADR